MVSTLVVIGIALIVLYGLIASTEKVLNERKEYVIIDERMTDHRSRL